MRLLHVIYSGLGGQGEFLFPLIQNLRKNSRIKNIIIFYGVENLLPSYRSFCRKNNIEFYYIKSSYLFSGVKYIYILNRIKPNLILIHTSVILKSIFFYYLRKTKLIFFDHTSNQVKQKSHWVNLFISSLFFSNIVFLAKFHLKEIQNNFFFRIFKNKFKLIEPGISLENSSNKLKKLKNIKKKIIYLGMASRFIRGKNHMKLINAFQKIQIKNKLNIRLSLVGTGPEYIKIKNYIANHKLKKNIILEGFKDKKSMTRWINKIDIYVHWSSGEVVSRSILEAMQKQKVIFASEIPSTKEQLLYGYKCGILFKNERDFINKINIYFSKRSKIRNLRKNCLKQIQNKYNFDKFVKKIENITGII